MHEVLVNRLGGLSLPRKSVVRLTDRPDMTLDVYRGRKTTMQQSILLTSSEPEKSGCSSLPPDDVKRQVLWHVFPALILPPAEDVESFLDL